MLTKRYFCPVNAYDCPYFTERGTCSMLDEGVDPRDECDDAGAVDGFLFEEGELPFSWEDENGNLFDQQELLEKGYHFVNDEPVEPLPEIVKSTL